jgi:putative membrane protein
MADDPPQPAPVQDPRVYLAAERTLLAWVRTGLALMGFGFVVARFGLFLREIAAIHGAATLPSEGGRPVSLWIGVALVMVGVLVNLLAAVDHGRVIRSLRRGDTHPATKSAMGIVVATVLSALGLAMAIYLLGVGR